MDMAFHPNGETVLIANQDAGSVSVVNLDTAEIVETLEVGQGHRDSLFLLNAQKGLNLCRTGTSLAYNTYSPGKGIHLPSPAERTVDIKLCTVAR